jgi:hypothetical protein
MQSKEEQEQVPMPTDCATKDGIIIGLIDSVITACRILVQCDIEKRKPDDRLNDPVVHALCDLQSNCDVNKVMSIRPPMLEFVEAQQNYRKWPSEDGRLRMNLMADALRGRKNA